MLIQSAFIPAKGLSSRHMQTLFPTIYKKSLSFLPDKEQLILPDGDVFEFDWLLRAGDGPIVVLLHGLAGGLSSSYTISMYEMLDALNWRAVLLQYRGRGSLPNQSDRTYHLADTLPVKTLLEHLSTLFPQTPLFCVGFSMGGNLLLKYLGEEGSNACLRAAVAVSTPFDVLSAAEYMQQGAGRFYQRYLIRDIHAYIQNKYAHRTPPFDLAQATEFTSFWDFDNYVTAPLNGFKDAADYYYQSSSRWGLIHIDVPTLCINSLDDPFMPPSVIPQENELSKQVTVEVSAKGGHVGFVAGNWYEPIFWLFERTKTFLLQHISQKGTIS